MVRVRPTATSSPPGTRSRRHNEARQQAKSRLSNGFSSSSSSAASGTTTNHTKKSKSDQIRTRSKAAKNAESSPNSARKKRRELQLRNNSIIINNHSMTHANSASYSATGAELKRLHIAMRFKQDKINHSSPNKTSTPIHNSRTKTFAPSTAKNGTTSVISDRNGLRKSNKNNISPTGNKNENKLNYRHQVLKSYKKKRETLSKLSSQKRRTTKSSEESDEDDDGADSENRDRKRRSALWVLNCEAEEFLFGETAAEKHEVVLPPKSVEPPNKRRRMRATELGELLKETPLLESKLRKSTSSGSEASPSSNSTGGKAEKAIKTHSRKKLSVKRKIFDSDETNETSDSIYHPEDDSTSPYHTTTSSASSPSCIGSPRPPDHSQAVRLQNIIENLPFRFSFQYAPTNEVWYQTFSRQESPTKTFQLAESPIVLPYERSSLSRRAFGRLCRLPRKSPRCHASTLAILSSLKPGGRSSRLNSVLSTPLSVNCSYDTPISTRSLLNPQRLAGPSSLSPKPCSSSSLQQPQSPTQQSSSRPRRNVTIQSPPVLQNSMSSCELRATEYVSDALAFLDDPYVVQLLAEERSPRSPIRIRSINKTAPPAPTTRSSQKLAKLDKNSNKRDASSPAKLVASLPKTSPKITQNGSHHSKLNNYVNSEQDLLLAKSRSPPSSPKHSSSSSRGSSQPSSPKHPTSSRGSSGPSSPQSRPTSPTFGTRKSTRTGNQPVVLVSDIYKYNLKSSPAKHGAHNCFGEEVLFQSAEWLPPLPSLD